MTETIKILPHGSVLVDYGPMHMFIHAFQNSHPLTDLAIEGGHGAMKALEDLASYLPVIKRKAQTLEIIDSFPDVVQRMIGAAKSVREPDLTPLAAVAGAASDVVADFLFHQGATKVIVDNGGDIAIRLGEGEVARVGVKTDIHAKDPDYLILIHSAMGVGGVATSGLGGRSFTKGIASAATVLSKNASLADAAATTIGNFTNIEDPVIKRVRAEELYPDTDIAGEWVTREVGQLDDEKIDGALKNGLSKADSLCHSGLIHGALLAVQGKVAWTQSIEPLLTKLSPEVKRWKFENM